MSLFPSVLPSPFTAPPEQRPDQHDTATVPPTLSLEAAKTILSQIEKVGTDLYAVDPRCQFCKGVHDKACPRVREIQYSPAGGIVAVRFWKNWSDEGILWPEEIVAIVMEAEELESKKE